MLIRLLGTLGQTRVGVGRLHILLRGPCGSILCLPQVKAKYSNLYGRFLFKLLFLETRHGVSTEDQYSSKY